ncbi:hypothetical protein [Pseudomonas viridiflava]|uniref:hypothetical protein n=1 Tax=Pseudomonas viridiflava TaxID=33069 RepID=UPI0013C34325|nr:hypothetical protein [Pseudomonas viridiflava]
MLIASKSGNISVATLISETDKAWTLIVENREVQVSKSDRRQRAFNDMSDALKWTNADKELIEHFLALDSGKNASVDDGKNARLITEPRFSVNLTAHQLNDLKIILDAATASEADPAAEIFKLMDQVRAACRQAAHPVAETTES